MGSILSHKLAHILAYKWVQLAEKDKENGFPHTRVIDFNVIPYGINNARVTYYYNFDQTFPSYVDYLQNM